MTADSDEPGCQKVLISRIQSQTIFERIKEKTKPEEGAWYYDKGTLIDLYTWNTSLTISSYENFLPNLDFFVRLQDRIQHLTISSYACQNISSLELTGFRELKEVQVGYNSFYFTYPGALPLSCDGESVVRIENCEKLEKILFDSWTFVTAKKFIVKGE